MNNRRITLVRPSQIFESLMDEFYNNSGLRTYMGSPVEVDMYETDNQVIVKAKAPGYKEDDVKITVEDNTLTIEGKLKEEKEEGENKKYHIKEMKEESFIRSVMIPTRVDSEKSEAEFENGVITIKMPKLAEVKSKTITIKTAKK